MMKDNQKKLKKDHIMDMAKARFERFGYKKTTVDEISHDARVSKKTIYEHFKNKEDIFVSIFIRETLIARTVALKAAENIDDPLEKIKKIGLASFEYQTKEPFFTHVLINGDGMHTPYFQKKFIAFIQGGIINILSDILKEGMEKGRVRRCDPDLTAYFIFKLYQSVSYGRTLESTTKRESREHELQEVYEFIKNAIKK
ncbi:MAG TPA: TetR/AcrR family transcriptional regulator [Bacteroidetes bacterium]|nr:TetR/AcrR family transcriptional regulator [Bacteroidota bacterium]